MTIDPAPPNGDAATLDTILDAARKLIAEEGYARLTMGALARAARLPLATIYRHTPDRPALMAAFIRRTDLNVLEALPEWSEADSPRERIFDLLMARFDQLLREKDMLRVVQRELRRLPGEALRIAPAMIRAMRWTAEAAGLPTGGVKGAARIRALAAAYVSVIPVWLEDEDQGHAKTMAALDRRLRRIEEFWGEAWGGKPGAKAGPAGVGLPMSIEAPIPRASPLLQRRPRRDRLEEMPDIVMTDDGIVFDGRMLEERPLGGAETSVIELANALAARGHRVRAFSQTKEAVTHRDVAWAPLSAAIPGTADLYIANRNSALLGLVPQAARRIFWIHNPASYLLKLRHQTRLAQWRPVIVFSGESHAGTYPGWAFSGGRAIIPYGVTEIFRGAGLRKTPPPRAIFASNPLRSLDWLLDLWTARIRPQCPGAELHVFAGAATYGAAGAAKAGAMGRVLERAAALAGEGVVLREPVPKARLVEELGQARVLLYRGDISETFCSAVAEAQAMGVPAVLEDIACMRERVRQGETGFVVKSADAFADRALSLLRDDALWQTQHRACLELQRGFGWREAAEMFERLL